jgi:CheY-like chemotaxis protein
LDRLQKDTPIYVFVAVKDTGPGLTPAELDILFQRFSQASPKTHTVFGGSGLGLFVCRKIAEVMGGRIEVVSEAGRGSTFRFFVRALPVLSAENPSAGDGEKHAAKNGPSATARVPVRKPSTTPHPRRRVLIVEDNLINQKVLTRQLKHIGLDVDVASDGREGLDKIRLAMVTQPPLGLNVVGADICTPPPSAKVRPFDCVLMDLEMPVLDGYTTTRCARDDEKAGTIEPTVIIALSKFICSLQFPQRCLLARARAHHSRSRKCAPGPHRRGHGGL